MIKCAGGRSTSSVYEGAIPPEDRKLLLKERGAHTFDAAFDPSVPSAASAYFDLALHHPHSMASHDLDVQQPGVIGSMAMSDVVMGDRSRFVWSACANSGENVKELAPTTSRMIARSPLANTSLERACLPTVSSSPRLRGTRPRRYCAPAWLARPAYMTRSRMVNGSGVSLAQNDHRAASARQVYGPQARLPRGNVS
jgi:hypothetical protein